MGKPKPASPPVLPGAEEERLSPGIGALLRGGNGGDKAENGEGQRAAVPRMSRKRRLVQGSLVFADILLLVAASDILLRRGATVGPAETGLCIAFVFAGASLSCLAIWLGEP
ncbi:MAG: hypothetical protein ACREIC_11935 [Limisphaerales bacterium]